MARRRFTPRPPREREPRTNYKIKAPRLRVIWDGKQEVMERDYALKLAASEGLDLVEVSPEQDPPVCKIIDYGKYKYELQKKKKEQAKHQHIIHVKEVKLRPKIATHDYDLKKRNAHDFLGEGNKVKVSLRFRGREITHPELGMNLMKKLAEDVKDVGQIETHPKQEGRQIIMVLAPRPGVKKKVEARKAGEGGEDPKSGGAPRQDDSQQSSQKAVADKSSPESVSSASGEQDARS